MRQLVTIAKINDVMKHPNADRLKIAKVGMWSVITAAELNIGDEVIFFEIDSLLPLSDSRYEFLKGRHEKTINGRKYSRLKTMRLRGEMSQGLVIPIDLFEQEIKTFQHPDNERDLQEILGILKYELPEWDAKKLKTQNTGRAFPDFIPKTDSSRIQNLGRLYQDSVESNELFEVSYKIDGSSLTIYAKDGKFGVCSKNLDLKFLDNWNEIENHFIRGAIDSGILFKTILFHLNTGRNIAVQGEIFGEGIQSNFENIKGHEVNIFNVYDIDEGQYLLPNDRIALLDELGIKSVPIYDKCFKLPKNPYELLDMADGDSAYNGEFREGLVFKSLTRDFSFKAVSNRYLEKTGH